MVGLGLFQHVYSYVQTGLLDCLDLNKLYAQISLRCTNCVAILVAYDLRLGSIQPDTRVVITMPETMKFPGFNNLVSRHKMPG